MTDQLRDWILQRAAHIGGTQVNKDGFNFMKNERVLRKNKKARRAERSLAYVLHRRVLGKVHKYRELRPTHTDDTAVWLAPHFVHISADI